MQQVAVPERMWFVDTGMGYYRDSDRAEFGDSPFENWRAAGRMFVRPWSGRPAEFDARLDAMQPGDPVFAYEQGMGVVAIGRVCAPKDLIEGPSRLYPRAGNLVKALAVDWDTSVTRTTAQVWEYTNLGGPALKSCGPETKFYPLGVQMLQEAHNRYQADPIATEVSAVTRIRTSPAYNAKYASQVVEARIGQGRFREAVLKREPACRLTGITQRALLVASHIKPWAACVGGEHLDDANGLALAPHIDHLFDSGLISFRDDGQLLLAPALDRAVLAAWHIDERHNVKAFAPDQAHYLAFHRAHVFGRPRLRRQPNLVGDLQPDELAAVLHAAE